MLGFTKKAFSIQCSNDIGIWAYVSFKDQTNKLAIMNMKLIHIKPVLIA